ncbi:TIGR02921 family PEP-CTERM protein [Oxynema aestuarii]|jgi:putative PEP-CTERM system integral membrane protein|uniref:TIGR02921 family PEP-CTERM protein n=1 Tax=Oxynema aestuarii AP17 TaxID=2064643 RepID=A0A6H1U300_9CYAN|nr:TIGR02921 family PEP-CTERM protein [Oxynema aestuarii]QIZ72540.1 TIGR02921 family PEP-CTERM protein [Oxynema aestuarii AP17]
MKNWLNRFFHFTFWAWNLTFLAVVYLGILPPIGIPLIEATVDGWIPLGFSLTLLGIIAIVPISCVIGFKYLRKQPLQLMRFFYGVEAPLLLLGFTRLFLIRQLTPASSLVLATIAVAIATFAAELKWRYTEGDRRLNGLHLGFHTIAGMVGTYVGILLLFYAVPLTLWFVKGLVSLEWLRILGDMLRYASADVFWWLPLMFLLFGFSCTLFIAMPSAFASFYIYSSYRVWRQFGAQYGRNWASVGAGAVVTAGLLIFFAAQQQPQIQAFEQLKTPPTSDRDRQELLDNRDQLRAGLTNAYLASYRYLSTTEENNHIALMYHHLLGWNDAASGWVQQAYNQVMAPFLYRGSRSDDEKAAQWYAEFFDTSIQQGERSPILDAVRSTYSQDQAKAGVLNVNEERVWLAQQDVNVTERGDWAEVEVHEVYANQTNLDEEVFYSFSLPESAVITGLWLGNTDDLGDRFRFQISPRGAAQQVYNEQVQRQVDPALLEQVGPRHYRLRAYPIPRKLSSEEKRQGKEQPQLHLWLTYKVMHDDRGWPMPDLGEKRNIFWTDKTQRVYNGETVKASVEDWFPAFVAARNSAPATTHQGSAIAGYRVTAQPLSDKDEQLPQNRRFAVILDRSYSMGDRAEAIAETFAWLKQNGFADNQFANNDADLYLTGAPGVQPQRLDDLSRFDLDGIQFYGSISFQQMLQQFAQLRADTPYDGILLVTDEGSYELAEETKELPKLSAPLWMVHLGGLPRAYDDGTVQSLQQSRGGVATDVESVLRRLGTQAQLGDDAIGAFDGYIWRVSPLENAANPANSPKNDGFEAIAARQVILAMTENLDPKDLTNLDAVHAIAKQYEIVSPYSSAIVLVNDAQRDALKRAEAKDDRFDREVEDGQETLSKPPDLMASPVPEPHQYLGAIAAIGLLIFFKRQYPKSS